MSKIRNNPLLKGASGTLGDVVVYRQLRNGQVIMANMPTPVHTTTERQLVFRERFKRAAAYGKKQMEDPIAKADYEAKIGNKLVCAYIVALTDFLKVPTVDRADVSQYLGRVGDLISILASDDFKVE